MNGKGYKGVLGKVFEDASKKDMPVELPLSIMFMVFVLIMTVYIAWYRTAKKSITQFKNRRIQMNQETAESFAEGNKIHKDQVEMITGTQYDEFYNEKC